MHIPSNPCTWLLYTFGAGLVGVGLGVVAVGLGEAGTLSRAWMVTSRSVAVRALVPKTLAVTSRSQVVEEIALFICALCGTSSRVAAAPVAGVSGVVPLDDTTTLLGSVQAAVHLKLTGREAGVVTAVIVIVCGYDRGFP
jgi:hypothetical protein